MAENIVHIPEELMARVQQTAESEKRSPQELVREAVETHLRRKRLQDFMATAKARHGSWATKKVKLMESWSRSAADGPLVNDRSGRYAAPGDTITS
jgi:predicted transcriptional regulator